MESARRPVSPRLILLCGVAVFVVAPVMLVATGRTFIVPSPDSDARISLWAATLPAFGGLLVARAVPPAVPMLPPALATDRRALIGEAWVCVAVALLFPAVVLALPAVGPEPGLADLAYPVTKLVLLLLVPWVAFAVLRWRKSREPVPGRRESLWRPAGSWRWLGPAPAVAVFAYLSLFSPLRQPPDLTGLDPVFLVAAAAVTFLTANVLEEIFYRVLLQTRLERVVGRWAGIVLGALLFALLHLPTHSQTSETWRGLPLTVAAIVTYQGVFGLFTGYLWSRFRNVWYLILAHTIVNTIPLFL